LGTAIGYGFPLVVYLSLVEGPGGQAIVITSKAWYDPWIVEERPVKESECRARPLGQVPGKANHRSEGRTGRRSAAPGLVRSPPRQTV
jgi:hypothetical protein